MRYSPQFFQQFFRNLALSHLFCARTLWIVLPGLLFFIWTLNIRVRWFINLEDFFCMIVKNICLSILFFLAEILLNILMSGVIVITSVRPRGHFGCLFVLNRRLGNNFTRFFVLYERNNLLFGLRIIFLHSFYYFLIESIIESSFPNMYNFLRTSSDKVFSLSTKFSIVRVAVDCIL